MQNEILLNSYSTVFKGEFGNLPKYEKKWINSESFFWISAYMWKISIQTSSHLDNKISWESLYRGGTEPVSSSSYKRIGSIKQGLKFPACQWYCQKVLDARTNDFINGPERINCKKVCLGVNPNKLFSL